jgi:simple sugar transport system ATP-binding protein
MTAPLIRMTGMQKMYGAVAAIDAVDFELGVGEIHSLLGENGAGKSTLTKMLSGVTIPTNGTIELEGEIIQFTTPAEAMQAGINMVYQENSLVPSMSVAQNLFMGDEKLFNRLRPLYIAAQQFLQSLNFNVDPWASVSTLGVAQRQMVEIARAVRKNARVIIFDEPTASLTPEEKHHFFTLIRRLKQENVSIIFISHALEEALEVSDRITVLRDGKLVDTGLASEFDRARVVSGMVGRTVGVEGAKPRNPAPPGKRVLSVHNLSMGKVVRNTSFNLYQGQVTGIFGLIGSGRTETAKVVSGVLKRNFFHGGEVFLEDQLVRYRVPRSAVRDGIVYVTEDRKAEGFFDDMSIAENIGLGFLAAGFNKGEIVRKTDILEVAKYWTDQFKVSALSNDARIIELSGGNQQKVVIAKSVVQKPRVIFFDEPTRGVDVGAIAEIHRLIRELAQSGITVVVISSYLPEILSISDRILVCRKGRIVEEFTAGAADEKTIMYAAVH